MTAFKGYPELVLGAASADGQFSVETKKGGVIATALSEDDATRIVDCWNATRKIFAPAAHIEASEDYCTRLEKLRKEAVARLEQAEAGNTVSAIGWNHDMSAAPLGKEVTKTREITVEGVKQDREYREHHVAPVWLATADGKVQQSYWIPAMKTSKGRWAGFNEDSKLPMAWMTFEVPAHPGVVSQEVAA